MSDDIQETPCARKFLNFVAANEERLKRNLRKNVTFDNSLFEDIFQDSILKTYRTLCNTKADIDDFEQYFFIASKFNFINAQNKKRKQQKLTVEIDYNRHDFEDEEYDYDSDFAMERKLQEITADIYKHFGVSDGNLYFSYIMNKVSGITSYGKIAELHNINPKLAKKTIQTIKTYIDNKYADNQPQTPELF